MYRAHLPATAIIIVVALLVVPCPAAKPTTKPDLTEILAAAVHTQVTDAVAKAKNGKFKAAHADSDRTLDRLIAWGRETDSAAFVDAAFHRRLLREIQDMDEDRR